MNEYYYIRYNLYKYFLNIDDDNYNWYLNLVILILYLLIILLTVFALILMQNISGFTIIYIIFLILFYIASYNLIISLKSISDNETLIKYQKFYDLRNIIFKENLKYALNKYKDDIKNNDIEYLYSNKQTVLRNINNTENIYGKEADKLFNLSLNSSYDLLKYFDLNEYIDKGYYNRLYITNTNFIQNNPNYIKKQLTLSANKSIYYIDLESLEDYPQQQSELFKYLNNKYNKKLSFTSKNIFTADFNKKLAKSISNYKLNIYYYIIISLLLIILLLHGLFVYFNYALTYIYFGIIILSLIIMYYFN
jgi:hypothetical protein